VIQKSSHIGIHCIFIFSNTEMSLSTEKQIEIILLTGLESCCKVAKEVNCCFHTRTLLLVFSVLVWHMHLTKVMHAILHGLNMFNGAKNSNACSSSSNLFCNHWLHNPQKHIKVGVWHTRKVLKQNIFEFQIPHYSGISTFKIIFNPYRLLVFFAVFSLHFLKL
jgi:hypothetical protein